MPSKSQGQTQIDQFLQSIEKPSILWLVDLLEIYLKENKKDLSGTLQAFPMTGIQSKMLNRNYFLKGIS